MPAALARVLMGCGAQLNAAPQVFGFELVAARATSQAAAVLGDVMPWSLQRPEEMNSKVVVGCPSF